MSLARIHVDLTHLFPLIKELLLNAESTREIIEKHINFPQKDIQVINKVLNLLTTTEVDSLRTITLDLQRIFEDGVIDINDIPIIVKIITDVISNKNVILQKTFTSVDQVGALVKILIIIMSRLELFNSLDKNEEQILKIIDSSIVLLNTSIAVSGNCKCCF